MQLLPCCGRCTACVAPARSVCFFCHQAVMRTTCRCHAILPGGAAQRRKGETKEGSLGELSFPTSFWSKQLGISFVCCHEEFCKLSESCKRPTKKLTFRESPVKSMGWGSRNPTFPQSTIWIIKSIAVRQIQTIVLSGPKVKNHLALSLLNLR